MDALEDEAEGAYLSLFPMDVTIFFLNEKSTFFRGVRGDDEQDKESARTCEISRAFIVHVSRISLTGRSYSPPFPDETKLFRNTRDLLTFIK
jgi:hypothetical protein